MQQAAQRKYDHIEGITPREPVGAVLTIGEKGPTGAPIQNDRFFIKTPYEVTEGSHRIRPRHPAFKSFNDADPELRKSIRGNIVHADAADAYHAQLRAQVLGSAWAAFPGGHPNRRPICEGDGIKATRLFGIKDGTEDWREIECPNRLCEFRQGKVKACKPFGRLYFRPRWKEGSTSPALLMKWATGSWNNVEALAGFFGYAIAQAKHLGIENPVLFGLPFVLTLARKSNAIERTSFPVVSISPDCDLIEFFMRQREQVRLAGGTLSLPAVVGAQSPEETTPEAIDADFRAITPSKPSTTVELTPIQPVAASEGPELLGPDAIARIQKAARGAGMLDRDLVLIVAASCGSGELTQCPKDNEHAILRAIEHKARGRK